jgi:hypothetical protein
MSNLNAQALPEPVSAPGVAAALSGDGAVDYDLHGLVGVRLLDAEPADARAVDRQLGPIRTPLEREPDITIRFVEELPVRGTVRLLGLDEAGYTEDAFLVLRGKHKTRARVQIRFEQIGGRCEITCESGLKAVPLLIPILNLTALAKGALPLHASAFEYEGTGILTTGWSKGGKTEALLTFMARGARYIGDEWVYLHPEMSPQGRHVTRMSGIPDERHPRAHPYVGLAPRSTAGIPPFHPVRRSCSHSIAACGDRGRAPGLLGAGIASAARANPPAPAPDAQATSVRRHAS